MRSGSYAIELDVGPEKSSPRGTRKMFAEHFADHPRLDDLLLCLSEVVTNAVLHGAPPIVVRGGVVDARIRVEVTDASKAAPVQRRPDHSTPTGRGLNLLDHLTSDWGVEVTDDGKTVWFEIGGADR